MSTDRPRFSVSLTPEDMKQLDDYRFNNRFNSRSAAAADLIHRGLRTLKEDTKINGQDQ